jgi:hypothetical protein|tara:strand:- start:6889 stop:7395 length:507 start_codon:yes stop_codon:yes gene_type:complete
MAFNVSATNSCKIITISGKRYDPTSVTGDVIFTHIESGVTDSVIMNFDAGTGRGRINVPTSTLTSSQGLYKVCLEEGGISYACKPVLLHCDIDCCLTKLTNELLDCSCDCPRCSVALAKAQKIFLLLQSAMSSIEIAGEEQSHSYYQEILKKYKKAREICDNSCGCDC